MIKYLNIICIKMSQNILIFRKKLIYIVLLKGLINDRKIIDANLALDTF